MEFGQFPVHQFGSPIGITPDFGFHHGAHLLHPMPVHLADHRRSLILPHSPENELRQEVTTRSPREDRKDKTRSPCSDDGAPSPKRERRDDSDKGEPQWRIYRYI